MIATDENQPQSKQKRGGRKGQPGGPQQTLIKMMAEKYRPPKRVRQHEDEASDLQYEVQKTLRTLDTGLSVKAVVENMKASGSGTPEAATSREGSSSSSSSSSSNPLQQLSLQLLERLLHLHGVRTPTPDSEGGTPSQSCEAATELVGTATATTTSTDVSTVKTFTRKPAVTPPVTEDTNADAEEVLLSEDAIAVPFLTLPPAVAPVAPTPTPTTSVLEQDESEALAMSQYMTLRWEQSQAMFDEASQQEDNSQGGVADVEEPPATLATTTTSSSSSGSSSSSSNPWTIAALGGGELAPAPLPQSLPQLSGSQRLVRKKSSFLSEASLSQPEGLPSSASTTGVVTGAGGGVVASDVKFAERLQRLNACNNLLTATVVFSHSEDSNSMSSAAGGSMEMSPPASLPLPTSSSFLSALSSAPARKR